MVLMMMRSYMCQTNAGEDINFSWRNANLKSAASRYYGTRTNSLSTFPVKLTSALFLLKEAAVRKCFAVEEIYVIAAAFPVIRRVTELMEQYRMDGNNCSTGRIIFGIISRLYPNGTRQKFTGGEEEEKEACLYTIATVLLETMKMYSIIAPFICEAIYQNLKEEFALGEESISHYRW